MHFGAFGDNQDTKNTDTRSHEQNDDSLIVPNDKQNLQPPPAEKWLDNFELLGANRGEFFIFYNIYFSQLSYFASDQPDERLHE